MMQEKLFKAILGPCATEKAQRIADKHNQVAFKVAPDATKADIKKAVELLFKVKVEAVQVLNVKGKKKRFGQIFGKRKNWKKAYVSLAEGSDLNFGQEA